MQFMVLGKYSNQGLAGFIQNPNDDRRAAISSMMEKGWWKTLDLHLTRGEYDIVAIGEVDSFDDIAAVKLLVASSGAVENLTILEMIGHELNRKQSCCNFRCAQSSGRIAPPTLLTY